MQELPDGLVAVVRRECPTCEVVTPVLAGLVASAGMTVVSQDDPTFPPGVAGVVDDTSLDISWRFDIETVPTLLRLEAGQETARTVGWDRSRWESFTGVGGLGPDLPDRRPGCGSRTLEPGIAEALAVRHRGHLLRARRVELSRLEDDFDAMWSRGWTDGLPVVPPTEARVLAMLEGTSRAPQEEVAVVPPDLIPVTVEKVAVNAVMAGCRPEYLPVVLASVEAACTDEFNVHGVLATTWSAGPVVVVNGPIARSIGMNSGVNVLGQGNRANSTIGRALQLVVRNVGGGRPGGVDRAAFGQPGKLGLSFSEDEEGSPWESLAVERGVAPGTSAVTVFAGGGVRSVADQRSRTPESLARSFALSLLGVGHPKLAMGFDAFLLVSPDHGRVFRDARWSKARLRAELEEMLLRPGSDLVEGAGGIAEGLPTRWSDGRGPDWVVPKFRPGGLLIAYAGGGAGLFSCVMEGWVGGAAGSVPVTREVRA
jgi:hypothetical protein